MNKLLYYEKFIDPLIRKGHYLTRSNLDGTPLTEDLGDVLPYLVYLKGEKDALRMTNNHLEISRFTQDGLLLEADGRIRYFHNHDWLLGLLFISSFDRTKRLHLLAQNLMNYLEDTLASGFLLDTGNFFNLRRRISSPYNLVFFEELLRYRPSDKLCQIFTRHLEYHCVNGVLRRRLVLPFSGGISLQKTRFFKDMSNGIHTCLSFSLECNNYNIKNKTRKIIEETWRLLIDGEVPLPGIGLGMEKFGIRDLFSWMDIIGRSKSLFDSSVTRRRVDRLLELLNEHKLDNGLFSEYINGDVAHLDGNVDLVATLYQFNDLFGFTTEELQKRANRILDLFSTDDGLVLRISRTGEVEDAEIVTKYQFLATKLCLVLNNEHDEFLLLDR